jgi:hypothetical protein
MFNERKTTQAAAKFLALAGDEMNYMVLIKLLYLLDRRTLELWGRPVSGATYFSMKHGPVLSEVHDLITELDEGYWNEHITQSAPYQVRLQSDPGDEELSPAEEEQIKRVFEEYKRFVNPKNRRAPFELAEYLHKILAEWTPVESGRLPLSIREILKAEHIPQDRINSIEEELEMLAFVDNKFVHAGIG